MRILLIGPFRAPIGGPVRLLDTLLKVLRQDNRIDDIKIISTGRGRNTLNPIFNISRAIQVFLQAIYFSCQVDLISYQASARGMIKFGPVLFCLSRFFRKPLVIRLFGSRFDTYYDSLGSLGHWIIDRTVLRSEACLFQTKRLVNCFRELGTRRAEWFSNHTQQPDLVEIEQSQRITCDKIIFLGHVQKDKGIGVILDTVSSLPNGVSLDIYGPLYEPYTAENINIRGEGKVCYRGVLDFKQVQEVLFEYDALVLPTFYPGEGYPGVIIEAFSHGLPVITSRWKSIPEIVDENSGILITPHSPGELAVAINRLHKDSALFQQLQRGAIEKRNQFSDAYWTNRFVEICMELVDGIEKKARHA